MRDTANRRIMFRVNRTNMLVVCRNTTTGNAKFKADRIVNGHGQSFANPNVRIGFVAIDFGTGMGANDYRCTGNHV